MICDMCGRDNAVIRMVMMASDGQKVERHLCAECMEKNKQQLAQQGAQSFITALANAFRKTSDEQAKEQEEVQISPCPECGTHYESVKKTGKFGCPECYHAFENQLPELLALIGGHIGYEEEKPALAKEERTVRLEEKSLRMELDMAIACENYERAAQIRDLLRHAEEEHV